MSLALRSQQDEAGGDSLRFSQGGPDAPPCSFQLLAKTKHNISVKIRADQPAWRSSENVEGRQEKRKQS